MGAVSLLPPSIPSLLPTYPCRSFPPKPQHPSSSIFLSTSSVLHFARAAHFSPGHVVPLRSSGNGRGTDESAFLDEDGVVKDMDGYLNYLSLEYDSVWDTKPSWCQPWTILLTGVTVTACSWVLLHSVPITAVISSIIFTWWYIFLYAYPKAYSDMIAERRKNVTSGVEDTFGVKRTQQ